MTSVFISYARADDELFAKRLYEDLTKEGFDVWWDRESLHSISLTFHQQIKDAIREKIDRLIYIAGPKASVSDYVREEWKSALEFDKPVISIVRMGDYDIVPGELSLLHCEDFRDDSTYSDQLKKLISNLRRPEPPLGHLFAVPSLPKHFMGRTEFLHRIKDAVQVDLQNPIVITGAASRVGVQGMGGIGKSVLAAAVARDREVRRAYPDGIIWISFGQTPDVAQLMRDVAIHLGNPGTFENIAQGQGILRDLLLNKAVLLVFDDVWKAKDAQAFDVLGPRCRALVTTRDAGILHALHGELYSVELFTEQESLSLLASCVEQTPDQLPNEATEIVKECGCLPLAITLCGGMAKKRDGQWENILKRLRRADLEKIVDRQSINEQHISIWRAMQISVEALDEKEQKRFAELSVFVTDQPIPAAAVVTLWEHTGNLDELDTEDLLINLSERSLIRLEKDSAPSDEKSGWQVSLHDLLYDYAHRTSGDKTELNNTLLAAYSKKCLDGWPTGANDGYFFQNLCSHLLKANKVDNAISLLTDIPWIEAKSKYRLVFDLQNDYRDVIEVLPEAQEELKQKREHEARVARWTKEIIEYSQKWKDRWDMIARGETIIEPEPQLPEIISSIEHWSEERIKAECDRIINNPTRMDLIKAFYNFVQSECYPLTEFGDRSGFLIQHAYNRLPGDPVRTEAAKIVDSVSFPILRHRWPESARYNPKSALLKTLVGHTGGISSVSVTPDGKQAISGSGDTIHFIGLSDWITRARFSESGDTTLRVWDLTSGQCLKTLEGHTDGISSVSVTPDGKQAISASKDKTLRVWDLTSGRCVNTLEGHSDKVFSVSVTPDGKQAVSASWDGTLRVWNLTSGRCVRCINIPIERKFRVNNVSVTPDGKQAVSVSCYNTLRVWDLTSGQCVNTLEGHYNPVSINIKRLHSAELEVMRLLSDIWFPSVSVTPDGKQAVSASWDDTLRVWNLTSGQCVNTLEGHSDKVFSVSVTPDGKQAISASGDKTLRVWDLTSGQCVNTLEGHNDGVFSVSVTPDGKQAISASSDKTLRVWDLTSGRCVNTHLEEQSFEVSSVSVTPDGKQAVSASWDDTLRVWDLTSGQCVNTLERHTNSVSMIIQRLYHYAYKRIITLFRTRDINWAPSVSVTPDGKQAVSAGGYGILRVWDLTSGRCVKLKFLKGHTDFFYSYGVNWKSWTRPYRVSVTSDGNYGFSASLDGILRVWDLTSGQCVNTLEGHTDKVNSVSVTSDGKQAVSASEDKTLRVWNLTSGQCVNTLEGHTDKVFSVSVTPDGKQAISASKDKTLRVWNLTSGRCLALVSVEAPWTATSFSAELNILIGSPATGQIALYDLSGL